MGQALHIRLRIGLAIVITIVAGLLMKYYSGPPTDDVRWFVNNWGASVAYEVCFMLAAFFWVPRRSAVTPIAVSVCMATIGLEFAQMLDWSWLDWIRMTWAGRITLGHVFSWWDLPAYPLGCAIGWLVLVWLVPARS